MSVLINICLALCATTFVFGIALFLYRLIGMLLNYVGHDQAAAVRHYAALRKEVQLLDQRSSEHVQRALTIARKEAS